MQRGSSRGAHPVINEQKGADSPGWNGLLTRERVNLLLYFWSIIHNLLENSFQHCHPISLQSFLIFRFSQAELTVIKGESVCPPCIRFNRTWLVYLKNKMKVREKKYIECWKNALGPFLGGLQSFTRTYFDMYCFDSDYDSVYWPLTSRFQNPIATGSFNIRSG